MYISDEQLKGFSSYKYSCIDTSPLANYVMHPFWNQFVKLFPLWVAPNVMTLVGFLFLVLQISVLTYVDPYMDGRYITNGPSLLWAFCALCQFLAHHLDGIDGKQARRTGTSSPLGELFDHGLDSWTVTIFTVNIFCILPYAGVSKYELYAVLWCALFPFMISHWEKYNTGVMYLPWAYDLSQVVMFLCYCTTAVYGIQMWKEMFIYGVSVNFILRVIFYGSSLFVSIPVSISNVIQANRNGTGKGRDLYENIIPIISTTLCFILCTILAIISPSDILDSNPRVIFMLSGVAFSNIVCRLIVSQMSNTRCEVVHNFIYLLLLCVVIIGATNDATIELYTLLATTLVMTLAHIHYGVVVVNTLANHLNIFVFSTKKKIT